MTLINDHNRRRDPRNDARVVIPNIDVAASDTLGPAPPQPAALPTLPAGPLPSDGGTSAAQLMSSELMPIAGVENLAPGAGPASNFNQLVQSAEQQIRGEFNWRRNAFTQLDPVPLYDSAAGNPWVDSPEIVAPRLDMTPAPPSERLRANLAAITGVDLSTGNPRGPFGSAFTSNNQITSRAPGGRTDRVGEIMRQAGFRSDNWFTRGIANLAGVGGVAISAADAVTNELFNQTFGRAIYGSARASRQRQAVLQQDDWLQPAREIGQAFLEPAPGESPWGVYGSGLPGMINAASDYIPNLVTATGLSVWRGARTLNSAMRGEDYAYRWDDPLWNAINPLGNDEVYSFLESPDYSPVSVRRYMPEELGEDATNAERIARRVAVVSLGTLGFLLDAGRPDIDTLNDLGRWASRSASRGGAAARNYAQPMPPPAPGQARLSSAAPQAALPGLPDRPLLPGGDEPFDPTPGPLGQVVPIRPLPPSGSGSAPLELDYEPLFITPDGVSVELPRDILQRVDDTLGRGQSVLRQPFPDAPGAPLVNVDPQELLDSDIRRLNPDTPNTPLGRLFDEADDIAERAGYWEGDDYIPSDEELEGIDLNDLDPEDQMEIRRMRAQGSMDAEVDPEALAQREQQIQDLQAQREQLEDVYQNARTEDGNLDPQRVQDAINDLPDDVVPPEVSAQLQEVIDGGDPQALDEFVRGKLDEFGAQLDEAQAPRPPLTGDETLQDLFQRADEIVPPVRQPGVPESLIRQAVDAGDLEVRPTGFVRATDAQVEAQKQLIAVRLELDQIKRIPETFRNSAERARLAELEGRFTELRTAIAGRTPRDMGASPLDTMLPVVSQKTLTPPPNPAKLYQWSRNLPPGQRIYLEDVDFDTRSARDLTELAKFFGHADVGRNSVLSADQLAQLRMTYGSLYSSVGPAIDRQALRRLNVEGVGRVEVNPGDAVTGAAQETRLVSNDVQRSFDASVRRAEEFADQLRFTQTEMSELATDEIQRLLDTRFSPKAIYADGTRNSVLARTRAELMDEMRYRQGEDLMDDILAEEDEIADYLEAGGEGELDVRLLDDDEFNRIAEEAALRAQRKADAPVREIKATLPDEMQPTSPQGDEAVREMAAAEQAVSDAMAPVKELVEIIEDLERQMVLDGRAVQNSRLPQDLNVGTYQDTGLWHTRQMDVDAIADRTVRELEEVSPPQRQPGEPTSPVEGQQTQMGQMPASGTSVRLLDGRTGTLTGSVYTQGGAQTWEVRLDDGSLVDLPQAELFPPDADLTRPAPASTRVWYLGTRADVNVAQYQGVYDSTMHSPLGPGTYLLSDPKMAEDAARAFVPEDAVGNYPINAQGRVSTVAASVDNVMSADMALVSMEEVWVGTRNLIKEFFGDNPADVRNITAAARRKNLAEFYDYLARKLDDDVRLFDFESRMAVFLHAQGIDAILWDSPNGSVLNVLRPNSLTVGDTTPVGGARAVEQMAAAANLNGAMANIFGTPSARAVADHSHFRFGLQLRDRLVGQLQEASDRVYMALERLDKADQRLAEIARTDALTDAQLRAQRAQEQLGDFIDTNENDLPGGCV